MTNGEPVSKELEELVRPLIKEIGCSQEINLYQTTQIPFGLGNNLYLRESDLPVYKEKPQVLRFVIAHELMHIENFHSVKREAAVLSIMALAATAGWVATMYSIPQAKTSHFLAKIVPEIPTPVRFFIATTLAMVAAFAGRMIGPKLLNAWWRTQETQADQLAVDALAHLYEKDELINGAAVFFSENTSFAPESTKQRLFLHVHPPSKQRLIDLGMSPPLARQAAENFPHQMHSWITSFMEVTAQKSKTDALIDSTLEETLNLNGKKIDASVNMASVDTESALSIIRYLESKQYLLVLEECKQQFLTTLDTDLERATFLTTAHTFTQNIMGYLTPSYLNILGS